MDNKRNVQESLDRSLSGLRADPYLAQRVIAQAKGETQLKRRSFGALVLAVMLALAMIGTAYALFSSRVAEFFGTNYGQQMGDWLSNGRIAQLNETITMGDITLTLDEVVYRSRGIYGVGTVRAVNANDVMLPEDEGEDPAFFAHSDEAQSLADKARTANGHLLTVSIFPQRIGVDGGSMLTPASAGYYDVRNADGSLTFSFEVEDGYALEEGKTYQMELNVYTQALDPSGNLIEGSTRVDVWKVSFQPTVMEETTAAPAAAAESFVNDYETVVPAAFIENGTLPVYHASVSRLGDTLDPEWFNQSGIAEKRSEFSLVFTDHATLQYGDNHLSYVQYSDEVYDYATLQRERFDPDAEPDLQLIPDLSSFIANIAFDIHMGLPYTDDIQLENEHLTYLSLADAQHTAEELLDKLGLHGYSCSYALDMSKDRIHTLGEKYNRYWHEGDVLNNGPRMDYGKATTDDEGYYLVYTLFGITDAENTHNFISVYIDRSGVALMSVRNDFSVDEISYTPDVLVTPDQAIATLNSEAIASRQERPVRSVQKVSLVYRAVRADNKEDGMIFAPVWRIEYKDDDSSSQSYFCWGEINAVNGKLIDAIFR